MGYLNELLSRNPLVIDDDTIRPHHKYTDDLYTGGKITMTNYDRIKSMSVEEMAAFIVKIKLVFGEGIYKHIQEEIKDYVIKIDENKLPKWKKKERKFYEQWLLQEVSDERI